MTTKQHRKKVTCISIDRRTNMNFISLQNDHWFSVKQQEKGKEKGSFIKGSSLWDQIIGICVDNCTDRKSHKFSCCHQLWSSTVLWNTLNGMNGTIPFECDWNFNHINIPLSSLKLSARVKCSSTILAVSPV